MSARIKLVTDNLTGERYYRDVTTAMAFRRITAALVWPYQEAPGCVTVLGEARFKESFLGQRRHNVHLCQEFTSLDPSMLIDKAEIWTRSWHILRWATPLSDSRYYMLEDANAELRSLRMPVIRYADPMGWQGKGEGLIPFYSALVRRRTQSEKTLFLGSPCAAASEISLLEEDTSERPTNYPAACALWFALADIDLNPRDEWGESNFSFTTPADPVGGY